MNIIHIVSTYPPYYGGMGNAAFQMVSRLTERGHRVQVLTPLYTRDTTDPSVMEMKDQALRMKPAIAFGNAAYLPDIRMRLEDADVVHLHYPFFGSANLVRKWKLAHPEKKLVITYHMDNRAVGLKGLFFKYYAKYWLPKILGIADVLHASSFDFIDVSDAGELYRLDKKKWIELPYGVDIERFYPGEKSLDLFVQYQLDPAIPTVLFVGGMDSAHYFKGVPILLRALREIKKTGKVVQSVLVGDGALREEFELLTKSFGLSDRVRFVGNISDDDLPRHYQMGDLFVLPSTTRGEAFGMVLLEAMASGVPVVASDFPGVRTVAEKGGMVVDPGNAEMLAEVIVAYFFENKHQEQWRKKARAAAENYYAWDIIIDRLEKIYNI